MFSGHPCFLVIYGAKKLLKCQIVNLFDINMMYETWMNGQSEQTSQTKQKRWKSIY